METGKRKFTALVVLKAPPGQPTDRVMKTARVHANRFIRTYNAMRRKYGRFDIEEHLSVKDVGVGIATAVTREMERNTPLSEWDSEYIQAIVDEVDFFLRADPGRPENTWLLMPPFLDDATAKDTLYTNTFVSFVQKIGPTGELTFDTLTSDDRRQMVWRNLYLHYYRLFKQQTLVDSGIDADGSNRYTIDTERDYFLEEHELESVQEFQDIQVKFDTILSGEIGKNLDYFRTNQRFPDNTEFDIPEGYVDMGKKELTPDERAEQAIIKTARANWNSARNIYRRSFAQNGQTVPDEVDYDEPPDIKELGAYLPGKFKRPTLKRTENGTWAYEGLIPPFGKPPVVNKSPEAEAWKREWEAKSPEEQEFELKKADLTARMGSLSDRAGRDREEFSKLSLEEQAGATNMFDIRQHEYHLQFLDLQQELDYLEHRRINIVQQPEEYQASFRKLTEKNEEREKSRKELQQKIRKLRGEPEEPPPQEGEEGIDADTDPAQTPQYTDAPSSSGGDMEDDDYNLPPPGAFNPWYRFRGTGGMGHGYPERLRKSRVGNWTGAPRPRYPTVNRPYTSNPWSRFIGNRTHITRMHSLGYDQDIVRSHPSPSFVAPHAALGQRGAPQIVDAVCPTLAPGVRHYLFG